MYTDLLIRIKNAQQAKKLSLKMPYSRMDMTIAEQLVSHGFIKSANKKGRMPKRAIEIELKYDESGEVGAITDVRFLSKPSRRLYSGYRELKPVKQGYGLAMVSTPNGVMTANQARKEKIGGQLLFEIW
ncbi:MAG: 30S ribosomal protein S8 [Candidatus Harrisonbacteria bacterium CG10_big_fil_rev_8_21_14_0_10_49_15]|uniref:Small ribosomal subunit protein uS8 n=1 Tax=Candidatus Harrisonbacteria bacterium CG10_big_fil_rev_8_21_14_0_10_49_15 TaxID=1974587 RepID=A0A2H0UKZ9_9BACT|nr:MAG: 30S ribosomal protein S8 [Candidatus Harrisonbacteria bacterium CG10_big_fil_rev_8_21_14_0_10_49_15]